jgi:hypothetical protein
MQQKYTFVFKGPESSGCFTAAFKTLPEIVSLLKEGNALCDLGLNTAINAQLKGFERDGLLKENDDMDLTGFFPDSGQDSKGIICSNADTDKFDFNSDHDRQRLKEALQYIDELAEKGYQEHNRLNVLSHILLFGVIGPFAFAFKVVKAPILEAVDLYGNSNATKTASGRIGLAVNGHEKDDDYLISGTQADTIPRMGDAISNSTFPKVVDELIIPDVSLSPSRRQKQEEEYVNSLKTLIDKPIYRKVLDAARNKIPVPALSPLIITSNPSPPLRDGALMKRLAARYFSEEEVHQRDSPEAIAFDAVLARLDKLNVLGEFRNKYVMSSQDNQQMILDRQLRPFEKARKIIEAAYQLVDMQVPSWLMTEQIQITGLQESIIDNREAVLVAFQTMIIDKFRILKGTQELIAGYETPTKRFEHLAINELIPFADVLKTNGGKQTDHILINTGIVGELYKYGVSKEQLPTLKALADYMKAEYRQSNGRNVIDVTTIQLDSYFARPIEIEEPQES